MTKYFTSILLFISFINLFAQQDTQPAKCTNPGDGILVGGTFTVSPEFACLDFNKNQATYFASNDIAPTGGHLNNLGYIFNFKDGDEISGFSTETSATVSKPGTYWIMQAGNSEGKAYITCKSVEVIQTEIPDIDIAACGDESITITFLDTPKNRKHGKYKILWGDNTQYISNQITALPLSIKHNFNIIPQSLPYIEAIYTRGTSNFDVCKSTPFVFDIKTSFKPQITKFETDNVNNQFKIKNIGIEGKVYNILAQEKGQSTWDLVGNTNGFSNIINNIDLSKSYIFKLNLKEPICQSAIESDSIGNIILGFDYPNKISWYSQINEISSFKNNVEYSLLRDSPQLNNVIQKFNSGQVPYLFNQYFENFYDHSFRLRAKNDKVEIISNIYTLPPLANEYNLEKAINVFPNPSEEIIQFNSTFQLKTVEIVDFQGKTIEKQTIEENQISVKHLPKGKYILRLYDQQNYLISNKTIVKM